jgi:hypothetical protein
MKEPDQGFVVVCLGIRKRVEQITPHRQQYLHLGQYPSGFSRPI